MIPANGSRIPSRMILLRISKFHQSGEEEEEVARNLQRCLSHSLMKGKKGSIRRPFFLGAISLKISTIQLDKTSTGFIKEPHSHFLPAAPGRLSNRNQPSYKISWSPFSLHIELNRSHHHHQWFHAVCWL